MTVSRFESRSLTGNSASEQETAVPPKSGNETRTPHSHAGLTNMQQVTACVYREPKRGCNDDEARRGVHVT